MPRELSSNQTEMHRSSPPTMRIHGFFLFAALTLALPAAAQKPGDPAKGKEVFDQCGVCHSATTDEKKMGPSLKGLFKKAKMSNGQKPTEANVLALINKGKGTMPAFEDVLTKEEKADLLAYLKTL
ncbi:MAG: c-type cytochrome [Acidobacteriota bacterium]